MGLCWVNAKVDDSFHNQHDEPYKGQIASLVSTYNNGWLWLMFYQHELISLSISININTLVRNAEM